MFPFFYVFAFFYKIVYYIAKFGDDTMLVYGKNVLLDMNPKKIRKVYLAPKKNDSVVMDYLRKNHIRYEMIPIERINYMVSGNHQGIVIDIHDYDYVSLDSCFDSNFVLILDHLEDPHNLGAIIRTAEAAGIQYIILPKDRSVRVNETVMKVSAGALDRVSIILVTNIVESMKRLQKEGFMIYASAMDGVDYKSISYFSKKALIIGNEGKGISSLVRKQSDEVISILMKGKVNSLNASVASGILIFHMMGE